MLIILAILLPPAFLSGSIYNICGTKTQVMNYILIHFSSVCGWWWRLRRQSCGGVNRICDGNLKDMIKGCAHNTLLGTVLEDLTRGWRVESEWAGKRNGDECGVTKEIWWSRLVWLRGLGQWDGSVQKGRWKQRVDLCEVWGRGDHTKPPQHLLLAFFSY